MLNTITFSGSACIYASGQPNIVVWADFNQNFLRASFGEKDSKIEAIFQGLLAYFKNLFLKNHLVKNACIEAFSDSVDPS